MTRNVQKSAQKIEKIFLSNETTRKSFLKKSFKKILLLRIGGEATKKSRFLNNTIFLCSNRPIASNQLWFNALFVDR